MTAFPSEGHVNHGFYYVGMSSAVPFSVLMIDSTPDFHVTGAGSGGQFFPRYTYEVVQDDGALFDASRGRGRRRVPTHRQHHRRGAGAVPRGIRAGHHQGRRLLLRLRAAALPGLPDPVRSRPEEDAAANPVGGQRDCRSSTPDAPCPSCTWATSPRSPTRSTDCPAQRATGPRTPATRPTCTFRRGEDALRQAHGRAEAGRADAGPRTIVYNDHITLRGVPEEAYRYMLGSRSAIEWIMERYQVKVDKASRHRQRPERLVARGRRPALHPRPARPHRHREPGDDDDRRCPAGAGQPGGGCGGERGGPPPFRGGGPGGGGGVWGRPPPRGGWGGGAGGGGGRNGADNPASLAQRNANESSFASSIHRACVYPSQRPRQRWRVASQ